MFIFFLLVCFAIPLCRYTTGCTPHEPWRAQNLTSLFYCADLLRQPLLDDVEASHVRLQRSWTSPWWNRCMHQCFQELVHPPSRLWQHCSGPGHIIPCAPPLRCSGVLCSWQALCSINCWSFLFEFLGCIIRSISMTHPYHHPCLHAVLKRNYRAVLDWVLCRSL